MLNALHKLVQNDKFVSRMAYCLGKSEGEGKYACSQFLRNIHPPSSSMSMNVEIDSNSNMQTILMLLHVVWSSSHPVCNIAIIIASFIYMYLLYRRAKLGAEWNQVISLAPRHHYYSVSIFIYGTRILVYR